jgi:hypothetical protein
MSEAPVDACRRVLDEARAAGGALAPAGAAVLAAAPSTTLEDALRRFADAHGAEALPVLSALGAGAHGGLRRAAKRALYRLAQRGIEPPRPPASRPVVERTGERPLRAWMSAIDGTGSRATWIVFEGAFGGLELCSLIVNDIVGILEVAGGGITRKRLDAELGALRENQKLPWIETAPARALALGAEALALHRTLGTRPPAAFSRWQARFEASAPLAPAPPAEVDTPLVSRGAELFDAPEMAGWFFEPANVQAEALEVLQGEESKLVVSDQAKAERVDALVSRVAAREMDEPARARWARRLLEMAEIFDLTARPALGEIARAAAGALAAGGPGVSAQPFPRALARRALDVAGEIATGRLSAADASRAPVTRA